LGWVNEKEYYEQQDINEFYNFLANIFELEPIKLQKNMFDMNIGINNNNHKNIISTDQVTFINLTPAKSNSDIKIKDLIYNWFYDNTIDTKNENGKTIKNLGMYQMTNTPYLISLSINRFNNNGERIDTNIIIQKKITLYNEQILNNTKWNFHSAVCHSGENNRSGHYYTLLSDKGKWYFFNDLDVPCMKEIVMSDLDVTKLIKKECVFLIYKLN
jgi:uncharacterized UBP type Zn finger protein